MADDDLKKSLDDIELEKRRWKNRRQMAWTSLIGMIFITICLLFAPIKEERLKVISEPVTWYYFCSASVIGAYMGFTTWAAKK